MAYSIDPIQDNCYPGTMVLVNKLNIRDETMLQEAETLATYINASKLEQDPLEGAFDFTHYKAVQGVRTKSWTKQRPQGGSRYIVHIRKESPRPAII